ncbi:MAG TPA: ABC transporter permease [Euzebya sp.]|nr:ABC transporter permease [Euzebya sp.]
MNTTILRLTARALLGRRRILFLLPLPALLFGFALLARGTGAATADWVPVVLVGMGVSVILPLTALIVGSSVLGLEIEDGTIAHVLTTPVPRRDIVLSKLVVAVGVTAVAAALPIALAAVVGDAGQLALGLGVGATVGASAYSAVFLALSVASRRPVAMGLLYILLWENVLGRLVEGARVLSIQQYAMSLASAISGDAVLATTVPMPAAAVLAVAVGVGATMAATSRLRSFALTGETS